MEQAMKFWEQSVHDLQKEVRVLRDRIDLLEYQQKNEKPRSIISAAAEQVTESVSEQAPPEDRLSRKDRIKSQKGSWF